MPLQAASFETKVQNSPLALQRGGIIEFEKALAIQRAFHKEVVNHERTNTLLLLQHPSVFTAGKRTLENEHPTDGTPVIEVDRGGKITWHGPGQIVGYPIVRLAKPTELVGFVRELESGLINVCQEFGLAAIRINFFTAQAVL